MASRPDGRVDQEGVEASGAVGAPGGGGGHRRISSAEGGTFAGCGYRLAAHQPEEFLINDVFVSNSQIGSLRWARGVTRIPAAERVRTTRRRLPECRCPVTAGSRS